MVRSLGLEPEVVVWEGTTTFSEQVNVLARTGVFIGLHGAGLMNEIFLPPGSVVIEIFPPHVKHVLYERICHNSGIYHFKVSLDTSLSKRSRLWHANSESSLVPRTHWHRSN